MSNIIKKGQSVYSFVKAHLNRKVNVVIEQAEERFKYRPSYRHAGGMEKLERTTRSLYYRLKHHVHPRNGHAH